MTTPVVERAARAVKEILSSYRDATTTDEREQIARLIAALTGDRGSLTDLAVNAFRHSKTIAPQAGQS